MKNTQRTQIVLCLCAYPCFVFVFGTKAILSSFHFQFRDRDETWSQLVAVAFGSLGKTQRQQNAQERGEDERHGDLSVANANVENRSADHERDEHGVGGILEGFDVQSNSGTNFGSPKAETKHNRGHESAKELGPLCAAFHHHLLPSQLRPASHQKHAGQHNTEANDGVLFGRHDWYCKESEKLHNAVGRSKHAESE